MRIPGDRVKRTKLIQTDRYVVAVEVELVIPADDSIEPCYEAETVQLLRQVREHADRGDEDWLRRHGKLYVSVAVVRPEERPISTEVTRSPAANLWQTNEAAVWDKVLARYWDLIRPENVDLERSLHTPDLDRLRGMDPTSWYRFLRDEYFRWKYTDPRRYATTTRQLCRYEEEGRLDELDRIRRDLLSLDPAETRAGLVSAKRIHGLGTAGASGLLALMYPAHFGTVDQFVAKALRDVPDLPEAATIARMNPDALNISDGVLLIRVMQRKAAELNERFGVTTWTPRRIDMALWAVGR